MPESEPPADRAVASYDVVVVGGGVNGAGIARDAAGRGLKVLLCEQDDLAGHTSSASTKLVHGGLRYLEHYEFSLVRKALKERAVLLRIAPHIARPLRFILPHEPHLRPAWLIRAGLVLYDHLAARAGLPATATLDLRQDPAGAPLKPQFRRGFAYFDGWIDDARLVVLNALDAAERGAKILPRTRCVKIARDGAQFVVTLEPTAGPRRSVRAAAIVNAAGPWAASVAALCSAGAARHGLKLVKGSHIVVPRLFAHGDAYIFQNVDGRIVFAIPYQQDFTLIGTTDVTYQGDPAAVTADASEISYLCEVACRYFESSVQPDDVVYAYAGVRPLLAGESTEANAASLSRDYALELESGSAPWLNVFGGKLTTYRRLAEEAINLLAPLLGTSKPPWTASVPLPGGDLGAGGVAQLAGELAREHPALPTGLLARYATAYGTRARRLLDGLDADGGLGEPILPGLYRCELEYLLEHEWAMTAEDVLWRRTKLGLHIDAAATAGLGQWLGSRVARGPWRARA